MTNIQKITPLPVPWRSPVPHRWGGLPLSITAMERTRSSSLSRRTLVTVRSPSHFEHEVVAVGAGGNLRGVRDADDLVALAQFAQNRPRFHGSVLPLTESISSKIRVGSGMASATRLLVQRVRRDNSPPEATSFIGK